jgi:plasmid stability protein
MKQMLVRNIDDEIAERFKAKAQEEGKSAEQVLRDLIAQYAGPTREQVVAEIDALRKRIGPVSGDSADLIREDRDNDEPYR